MSQPTFDTHAIAEIRELMGDTYKDIIRMSIQSLPEQLEGIKSAIHNRNVDNLFDISHKMKSSSSSIGALGLARKAEVIEMIGRDGSTDVAQHLLDELSETLRQVLLVLNEELES